MLTLLLQYPEQSLDEEIVIFIPRCVVNYGGSLLFLCARFCLLWILTWLRLTFSDKRIVWCSYISICYGFCVPYCLDLSVLVWIQ